MFEISKINNILNIFQKIFKEIKKLNKVEIKRKNSITYIYIKYILYLDSCIS